MLAAGLSVQHVNQQEHIPSALPCAADYDEHADHTPGLLVRLKAFVHSIMAKILPGRSRFGQLSSSSSSSQPPGALPPVLGRADTNRLLVNRADVPLMEAVMLTGYLARQMHSAVAGTR